MNSKVRVSDLQKMLKALSEKSGLSLNQKNLQIIGEEIRNISDEYLYKKIYNPIQKLKANAFIGLRASQLDEIAKHLEYENFKSFVENNQHKQDPQLLSLLGNYYSYVRRNNIEDEGLVFRSPVQIIKEKGTIWMELKGPSQTFLGEVKNKHGCLFILLEAKEGKAFHHVYKIGERKTPLVLQGIFSGVSTAFDPIGGRVVLIRTSEEFASMKIASLEIQALKKSASPGETKLAKYFKDYANNNVAPNRSASFGLGDL
jgi:hypothetical protein